MKFATVLVSALALLAACTPGGTSAPLGGGGGTNVTTIDVNLTLHTLGYLPDTITVPVGSSIRFMNSDGFAHTATLIPGATTFPSGSPFGASAQTQSGTTLSQPWSSGTLQAGSASQTITVDLPGTYLFGCFFHYGAPMRGTIVAQ
jgi:plastocyanin